MCFQRSCMLLFFALMDAKARRKQRQKKHIRNILNETNVQTPAPPPDPESMYMTAIIEGKKWIATQMKPDYSTNSNYKMIDGSTDEYSISFNIYKPDSGDKRELSEENMINFMAGDDYYSGKNGTVEVSVANDVWVEGNFHFTASSTGSGKPFKVTNGFFRVARNDPLK